MKTEVFEKHTCTPAELYKALENNWEGSELLRRRMLDAAKYGNDIDDVDYIVRDSMNWYYDELTKYTPAHGGTYCPSPQTLAANAYTGESIGATPDLSLIHIFSPVDLIILKCPCAIIRPSFSSKCSWM